MNKNFLAVVAVIVLFSVADNFSAQLTFGGVGDVRLLQDPVRKRKWVTGAPLLE